MFNSSILTRRLLRNRYMVAGARRQMSVLLVPLEQKDQLPFEARHQD